MEIWTKPIDGKTTIRFLPDFEFHSKRLVRIQQERINTIIRIDKLRSIIDKNVSKEAK